MTGDVIPVLWLCGPPGVGKTAVGWEIFSQLTRAGIGTGYIDIDQLGMCYPEAASDPGRHRMKAQNLGSVVVNFRAAGARCVIVSGVVDAARGVHADMIPQAAVTVCRLRVGRLATESLSGPGVYDGNAEGVLTWGASAEGSLEGPEGRWLRA